MKNDELSSPTSDDDSNTNLPTEIPSILDSGPFKLHTSIQSPTDWLSELGDENTMTSTIMSKTQYVIFCDKVKSCLDDLLSEGKTSTYATISKLFKSFRSAFSSTQKLRNKVLELETENKLKGKRRGSDSADQIEGRNEKIKYLEGRLEEAEIRRTQAEKATQETQKLLEQEKSAAHEKKTQGNVYLLQQKQSNQEMHSDTSNAPTFAQTYTAKNLEQKQEFDKEMRLEENEKRELLSKILKLEDDLKLETQKKVLAQVLITKRDKDIEKHQTEVETFEKEIHTLKSDLETSNSQYKSLVSSWEQCQNKLNDAIDTNHSLKASLSIQKFRVMTARTKKSAAEKQFLKTKEDNNNLQSELNKSVKLQSDLEAKVHVQGQKLSELKVFYEHKLEAATNQNIELQKLLREDANKDELIEKSRKEIQILINELKDVNQELKDKITDLKEEQQINIKSMKNIESLTGYVSKLEYKLKSQEAQNEELDIQVIHLMNTVSELRKEVKSLDYRDVLEREEVLKLKKKLKNEKLLRDDLKNSEQFARRQLEVTKLKLDESKRLNQAFADSSKNPIEELKKSQDIVRKLKLQVDSLMTDNNTLTYTLEQSKKKNQELYGEVRIKEKECFKTLEALDDTGHELELAKQKYQRLVDQKIAVECKVAEKDKEIQMKNGNIANLDKELLRFKKDLGLKLEEIKILETEIGLLKNSIEVMKKQLYDARYLKRDVNKVTSLFEKEKMKTKAMEHALQTPTNVHRWRFLEGSDPNSDQLIRRNLQFQREITKKTESLVKMEADMKLKEETISELQLNLERYKGSEDTFLLDYKNKLHEAKDRIRTLVADKEVSNAMFSKYRNEIAMLRDEGKALKLENKILKSKLRG
ncbi:hypothetical protein JTE90_023552 [Oedothorax gibbosus]|uniref:Uncharacterized protein n=1 Tax=Oedothorax gibbosus TaxID=931172 RepID=A0AAV6U0I4_9ARAC|nr:hypothetical protein JTE90_023552 [Oedothorax gibbosus]